VIHPDTVLYNHHYSGDILLLDIFTEMIKKYTDFELVTDDERFSISGFLDHSIHLLLNNSPDANF